jgi:hypothetical protein
MTVLVALLFDGVLVLLGRWLMPWTRLDRVAKRSIESEQSIDPPAQAFGRGVQQAGVR